MKYLLSITLSMCIGLTLSAQENVTKETTIKKTTITDQDGTTVITKKKVKSEKQDLILTNKEGTNFTSITSPMQISTKIYYKLKDKTYAFNESPSGMVFKELKSTNLKSAAIITPIENSNTFYFDQDGYKKKAYFKANGDLVVESTSKDGKSSNTITYKVKVVEENN